MTVYITCWSVKFQQRQSLQLKCEPAWSKRFSCKNLRKALFVYSLYTGYVYIAIYYYIPCMHFKAVKIQLLIYGMLPFMCYSIMEEVGGTVDNVTFFVNGKKVVIYNYISV